jgi:hypothetical protein
VLCEDWACTRTGVMRGLGLYKNWCYARTGLVQELVICEDWACTRTGDMRGLGLYKNWCYARTGVMRELL